MNCLFFISSFLEILDLTFLSFCSFHGSYLSAIAVLGLVDLGGLEPPTSRLSGVRSNQLSYRSTNIYLFPF